jgi:peptide/nickel transport system substrate-binding protein
MNTLIKTLKALGYIAFFGVMVWLAVILFFEAEYNGVIDKFSGLTGDEGAKHEVSKLVIAEPLPMQGFEPTVFDSFTRQRLNNIYEGLIKPDRDLNMKPALALSWGMIDGRTWEFVLRPDVIFHDGTDLDAEDVYESIMRSRDLKTSQLKDLLSTIKDVRIVDDLIVVVETYAPDPLLLQKLATVYVLPSLTLEQYGDEVIDQPVGTNSYQVESLSPNGVLGLKRFDRYWGDLPVFREVEYVTVSNTAGRAQAIRDGSVDVLDYVPHDFVGEIEEFGGEYDLYSVPSLEVQFIMFNGNRKLLQDPDLRRAVVRAIDREGYAKYLGEFARPSYQFVSNGVFGFNPDIYEFEYDLDAATNLLKDLELDEEPVKVCLPKGLENLGEYLTIQFAEVGLKPIVEYLEGAEYLKALQRGRFDIYFMGFRSELGDASDFFTSVVHSQETVGDEQYGQYNFAKYSDKELDELIEAQEHELDEQTRLEILQSIMERVVEIDVLGTPLFEYETVFAAKKNLKFEPRIDGFIYLNELTYED